MIFNGPLVGFPDIFKNCLHHQTCWLQCGLNGLRQKHMTEVETSKNFVYTLLIRRLICRFIIEPIVLMDYETCQ